MNGVEEPVFSEAEGLGDDAGRRLYLATIHGRSRGMLLDDLFFCELCHLSEIAYVATFRGVLYPTLYF